MANGKFRLLETFRLSFAAQVYKHRNSTIGNKIGRQLFEDLLTHRVCAAYVADVQNGRGVVNSGGSILTPRQIRRNDSVYGCPPAGAELEPIREGFNLLEGPVAEPRIGCEVKIIAKSQQKQIDRVVSDLENFVRRMNELNRNCINLAVVGINHETNYVGHEGERSFRHLLRANEPKMVHAKLKILLESYDEVLVLRFRATNQEPYPFRWLSDKEVNLDYGAVLTRIGEAYQRRFR
jgi:hypothetical protein